MNGKPSNIMVGNAGNIDTLLSKEIPVLVDFWVEWCRPCRFMEPVFQELDDSFSDRIVFERVNVDENPGTASTHGVRSIPTFVFKHGREVKRIIGAVGKEPLRAAPMEALE